MKRRDKTMRNESKAEILRFFMFIGTALMIGLPMVIGIGGIFIYCACGPFLFLGSLFLPDIIFEVNTLC
jgi:hypothetical protein